MIFRYQKLIILFSFLMIVPSICTANDSIYEITDNTANLLKNNKINISKVISIRRSSNKEFQNTDFHTNKANSFNIEYTKDYIWFKITLKNNSSNLFKGAVHFTSSFIDTSNLFLLNDGVLTKSQTWEESTFRLFNSFYVNIPSGEQKSYVVKLKSIHRLDSEVNLYSLNNFFKTEYAHIILNTLYFGIILSLLIYNFVLFFLVRETAYFIYSSFLFFVCLTVMTLTGYLQNILGLYHLKSILGVFSTSAAFFTFTFAYKLLDFEKINQKLFQCLKIISTIIWITCCTLISLNEVWIGTIPVGTVIDLYILYVCITVLGTTIYINFKNPSSESKVYLLSWLILYASAFAYFASSYGLIEYNFYTQHSILFGNVIETFVLSIALGLKINRIKKENEINKIKNLDQQKYIRLLRVLSHDIANSLFVISGYASRYLRRGHVDDKKAWPKIYSATNHIKDILDNVKSEQALINNKPEMKAFALKELINNIETIFRPQCDRKNIKLKINQDNINQVIVSNLPILTHQIIGNVISNAIKFTPEGGFIKIDSKLKNDHLVIDIIDNGIGIKKEKIQKIKNHHDTGISIGTLGEKGSGFGYFIIRSYSELLNITFIIENQNPGTLVSFKIPIKEE